MRCKEMFTVLALVAPLAVGAVMASPITTVSEATAASGLPNLCSTTSGLCEAVPAEEAPELRTNVCWDGKYVKLKGTSTCTNGGRAYYLEHGIILDSTTNLVLPLAAVIDTCVAGYCMPNELDTTDIITDGVACCNPKTGECEPPDENGVCTFGDITWCKKLEDNGDGTVTCHE